MHPKLLDRIVKKCERAACMRKHLPASWQLANVCFVCRGVQVEIVETSLYRNVCWGFSSLLFGCSALKFPSKKYGEQKEQFLRHCEIFNEDYTHWSIPREGICQIQKFVLLFTKHPVYCQRCRCRIDFIFVYQISGEKYTTT